MKSTMNKSSRQAQARSKSIDHQIEEERERREREVQLLILGGASSGKSTFIKQLRLHYGDGFPAPARQTFIPYIIDNVTDALNILLEEMTKLGIMFNDKESQKKAEDFRRMHPRLIVHMLLQSLSPDGSPTDDTKGASSSSFTLNPSKPKLSPSMEIIRNRPTISELQQLWADPLVKTCYARRHEFSPDLSLSQAGNYFLQNIERVLAKGYIPTIKDILFIRKPTLGVQEHQFNIDNVMYRAIDVAGQKSQRKKWIHFFESVTAVVFFAALSGFNECLEEEKMTNSLQDSIQTFREVTFNKFLERTEFILFLNKWDLFQEKLKTANITTCFKDYTGETTPESSAKYIQEQFLRHKPLNKKVYCHITCAVDTIMMKKALVDVFQIIVEINMQKIGTF